MSLADYLAQGFVRNALIAATLVAITAGLIGPLVIVRDLAFAVHGTAELAFTGAAACQMIPTFQIFALSCAVALSGARTVASNATTGMRRPRS